MVLKNLILNFQPSDVAKILIYTVARMYSPHKLLQPKNCDNKTLPRIDPSGEGSPEGVLRSGLANDSEPTSAHMEVCFVNTFVRHCFLD